MDRNQLVGLTLIAVMLITYTQFFAPKPPAQPVTTKEQLVPVVERAPAPHQEEAPHLAALTPVVPAQYGIFAPAMQGTEKEVVLENEDMRVTLTSRGGRIKQVVLKNYQDHQSQPFTFLDEQSSYMGFQLSTHGMQLNTSDLFFKTADQAQSVKETGLAKATFTLPIGPGQYIRQVFSFPGKGYTLTHAWEMVGLGAAIVQGPIQFVWHDRIKRAEKDLEACRNKTTVNYYLADDRFDHLKERSEKKQEQLLQSPVQWLGIKQRFFTAGIIAQEAFTSG